SVTTTNTTNNKTTSRSSTIATTTRGALRGGVKRQGLCRIIRPYPSSKTETQQQQSKKAPSLPPKESDSDKRMHGVVKDDTSSSHPFIARLVSLNSKFKDIDIDKKGVLMGRHRSCPEV